jgi:hypothetical protein
MQPLRYALRSIRVTLQEHNLPWQLTSLVLNQINSPGLSILQNLEMPLIVKPFHPFILRYYWTCCFSQGILPTLIIVLVHFDMLTRTDIAKELPPVNFRDKSQPTNTSSSRTLPGGAGSRMEFQTTSDDISEERELEPARLKTPASDTLYTVWSLTLHSGDRRGEDICSTTSHIII